jgi:hypothetical protein
MSSRPTTVHDSKPLFLVYAPDKPNSFAHRLGVREQHLASAKKLIQEGIIRAFSFCPLQHPLRAPHNWIDAR